MKKESLKYCSICTTFFYGKGHPAMPIAKGYCCDECSKKYVMPIVNNLLEAIERGYDID